MGEEPYGKKYRIVVIGGAWILAGLWLELIIMKRDEKMNVGDNSTIS